jgi:hypothetical protein
LDFSFLFWRKPKKDEEWKQRKGRKEKNQIGVYKKRNGKETWENYR